MPISSEVADEIKRIRQSKNLKLKPSKYISGNIRNFEGKIVPVRVRNYQAIGILNLLKVTEFILGDEPGLGKTLQVLYTYAYLRHWYPALKLLWVGPKSSFSDRLDDVQVMLQQTRVMLVRGGMGKQARIKQWRQIQVAAIEVAICNYHTIMKDYVEIAETYKGYPLMLVGDEIHAVSNINKTHKAIRYIARRAVRRVGVSATVLRNRLSEVYGIYRVINPDLFATKALFEAEFCIYKDKYIGYGRKVRVLDGYKNLNVFRKMIAPYYLGRTPEQVGGELPEIVPRRVALDMEGAQAENYDKIVLGLFEREVVNPLSGKNIKQKINSPLQVLVLSQLASCAIQMLPEFAHVKGYSSKEKKILDLLQNDLQGKKMVIFAFFKSWLYRLRGIIKKELGFQPLMVCGDNNDSEREDAKRKFNQESGGGNDVILITTAGKESINLTAAQYMLFGTLPWSYGDFRQIVGRIARLGSHHDHAIALLLMNRNSVDDHMLDTLKSKQTVSQALFDDSMTQLEQASVSDDVLRLVKDLETAARKRIR